jgi:hypothetical protein
LPGVVLLKNGDAQIGAMTVGGDWVASSLVAGVDAGGDGLFGTSDDVKGGITDTPGIVSKITSVTIGGLALGAPNSTNPSDGFGFVAQQIGSLKVNGFDIAVSAGTANDLLGLNVGLTGDLKLLEVAL